MYVLTSVCMSYIHTYIRTYVCMSVCMYVLRMSSSIFVFCVCKHACYLYTYVYIHICKFIHIYTYIRMYMLPNTRSRIPDIESLHTACLGTFRPLGVALEPTGLEGLGLRFAVYWAHALTWMFRD